MTSACLILLTICWSTSMIAGFSTYQTRAGSAGPFFRHSPSTRTGSNIASSQSRLRAADEEDDDKSYFLKEVGAATKDEEVAKVEEVVKVEEVAKVETVAKVEEVAPAPAPKMYKATPPKTQPPILSSDFVQVDPMPQDATTQSRPNIVAVEGKNKELIDAFRGAAVEGAKDLFKALRYTAASALTSTLPDEQRKVLVSRVLDEEMEKAAEKDKKDEEEYEIRTRSTVAEAVAEALAAESQRESTRWEREKETIFKQAEDAARQRVESELVIQKQRLEEEQRAFEEAQAKAAEEELALQEQARVTEELKRKQEEEAKVLEAQLEETKRLMEEKTALAAKAQEELDAMMALSEEQKQRQVSETEALKQELELAKQEQAAAVEKVEFSTSTAEKALRDAKKKVLQEKEELLRVQAEEKKKLEDMLEAKQNQVDETAQEAKNAVEIIDLLVQKADTQALEQKKESEELRRQLELARQEQTAPASEKESDDIPSTVDAAPAHPILGPVVADLGYKRLHFVSARELAAIPIWRKQRIYRHDRAKSMAADKIKTMHLGMPGVICLHEEAATGKLSIIDGQHRVGMMHVLQQKLENDKAALAADSDEAATIGEGIDILSRVLVEVYPQQERAEIKNHAEEIFVEINKSEPVKLIDLPGVAKNKDRKIITEAANRLQDKFPEMFSPSQRCRAPNLNVDNLRDSLFAADIIRRHNLTSASKMLDWMFQQNLQLAQKYDVREDEIEGIEGTESELNTRAWKKAKKFGFYLGLDSSWLYN